MCFAIGVIKSSTYVSFWVADINQYTTDKFMSLLIILTELKVTIVYRTGNILPGSKASLRGVRYFLKLFSVAVHCYQNYHMFLLSEFWTNFYEKWAKKLNCGQTIQISLKLDQSIPLVFQTRMYLWFFSLPTSHYLLSQVQSHWPTSDIWIQHFTLSHSPQRTNNSQSFAH